MLTAFREGEGREIKRETHIDWLPLIHTPTRDRTRDLGMCPDQEPTYHLSFFLF